MANEPEQVTPPSDQPEEQTAEAPEYREISQDELREILEQHRKWVETEGKEGKRADLQGADLREARLENANLEKANLQGAQLYMTHLENANLSQARLEMAVLFGAHLQGAHLGGAHMEKADLRVANLEGALVAGANLEEAHLEEAHLKKANLHGANLEDAHLVGANLQQADLQQANLHSADLSDSILEEAKIGSASLRNANLKNANLTDVVGLLAGQLAGSNLSGAQLPNHVNDAVHKIETLTHIEEISKKASKLFISILLGCVYAWLTIFTTTDVRLFTKSTSTPLPIIQTEIRIAVFYWAAPLILLSLFIWFQLYLQRLWERMAEHPAVFPDGVTCSGSLAMSD